MVRSAKTQSAFTYEATAVIPSAIADTNLGKLVFTSGSCSGGHCLTLVEQSTDKSESGKKLVQFIWKNFFVSNYICAETVLHNVGSLTGFSVLLARICILDSLYSLQYHCVISFGYFYTLSKIWRWNNEVLLENTTKRIIVYIR